MKKIIFILVFLFVIVSQAYALEWYEGGDLHAKTAKDWHEASLRNRIATTSDFIAKLNPSLFSEYFADNSTKGPLQEGPLKDKIYLLKKCISGATSDTSSNFIVVNQIAAACSFLLVENIFK